MPFPRRFAELGAVIAIRKSRVLLALAGLVLGLLAVEGLVRLRQWLRYGTTVASFYHLELDPASGLMIPRPLDAVGPIRVNSLGFRGPEIERPKPPGRVRVAFLGGSTTFCAEASSLEATWPHLVVEGLQRAAADLEFDYVNGGGAGYSSEQSLVNLEVRIAPLQPDAIVLYEATNDLTRDSRRLAIEQGLYEAEGGDHSRIGDWWLTFYLLEKNIKQFLRAREHSGAQLRFEPARLSAPFRERLTTLVREAQALAPVVVLVTFSTQMRREQPADAQRAAAGSALFYMPFLSVAQLLASYEEYNRVIREVALATGAALVEGEHSIPGDREHFADSVHFRDPGLRLQAERVLRGLLGSDAYRALLERKRAERGE